MRLEVNLTPADAELIQELSGFPAECRGERLKLIAFRGLSYQGFSGVAAKSVGASESFKPSLQETGGGGNYEPPGFEEYAHIDQEAAAFPSFSFSSGLSHSDLNGDDI